LHRLLFPITYIASIAGKRGRYVKGKLKGLNSVAIKFIIKVIYITIRLIKIPIRISIRRQKRAKRDIK
jgi:hypothetical protein